MNCKGRVTHENGKYPIAHARVSLFSEHGADGKELTKTHTDDRGNFNLHIENFPVDGYPNAVLRCIAFGHSKDSDLLEKLAAGKEKELNIHFPFDLGLQLNPRAESGNEWPTVPFATAGKRLRVLAEAHLSQAIFDKVEYKWKLSPELPFLQLSKNEIELVIPDGYDRLRAEVLLTEKNVPSEGGTSTRIERDILVQKADIQMVSGDVAIRGPVSVQLHRTASDPTLDQSLWVAIRNRTRAISFSRYQEFMNRALNWEERHYEVPKGIDEVSRERIQRDVHELGIHLHGIRAYQTLKLLTETFLLCECGVRIDPRNGDRHRVPFDFGEEGSRLGEPFSLKTMEDKLKAYLGDREQLPYITRVVKAAFPEAEQGWGDRLISAKINEPCLIELIWSYWMEEGMLVQTMNAVSRRFQNVRGGDRDPLANVEIDPLRPLNNLLWGYVQDEFNRLTVRRRAYEYVHHYGLTLFGKAASDLNAADRRSKFLEAFHNLLYQASIFFKEDFQTTVIADGFQLLNSLKEVHLVLAQGAQNQFGDLPWTARVEMLLMQYMLARREIRDFLQSRAMVPYKEPWEAQVDTMKTMQGWTDTTVSHFRDLAVYGEQILLSIRYADWINVNSEDSAKNWARYFRPEIQGYLHAYRAATGIDLTNGDTVDATIPGILLQKRTVMQRTR
jgi:hypothetical protein